MKAHTSDYTPPSRTTPREDAFVLLILMVVVAGLSFFAGRIYERQKVRRSEVPVDATPRSDASVGRRSAQELIEVVDRWRGEGTTPAPALPFGGAPIQHDRASGGDGVLRFAQEGATCEPRQKKLLLAAFPSGMSAVLWRTE
jgi:hypothetical protein